jgi:MOSC domain-containing protein YiiM
MTGLVESVSQSNKHGFSKRPCLWINLLAGLGVEGDAHLGSTVQHRFLVARAPTKPNRRQVHLVHHELLEELADKGFAIGPGQIGENILTRGVDLLGLPTDTILHIGRQTQVRVTGLRNPCNQLNRFKPGLMAATLDRDSSGKLIRKAGIMGVVLIGGEVRVGDVIQISVPPNPHRNLQPV